MSNALTPLDTTDAEAQGLREQIMALIGKYYETVHTPKTFVPGVTPVPVSGRVYAASDMCALMDATLDFWLTTGRFNDQFEAALKQFIGTRHVLTVNSGSSANLVAFASLTSHLLKDRALKAGDEIITAGTGFPTTLNPALTYGLIPVFVDVDIPTYNIDVTQIEASISPKTRAIMVAHTLGNPFDLDAVMAIAKKHNLFVVEDCCDALGATYHGKSIGTFGDIATLSFYPAHHITMGEGGAVFTSNSILKRAAESIRDWGRDCYCAPGKDNTCNKRFCWKLGDLPEGYDHKYIYSHLGYNLKITDMQAAVGLAQMQHLPEFIAARRRNFARLKAGLSDLQEIFILPEATPHSAPSWFGFTLTLRDEAPFTRDALVQYLNEQKIGTRFLFAGNLTRQPYMIGRPHRKIGGLENSDRIMNQTFWLGVFPGLGNAAIDYVIEQLHAYCKKPR